MRTAAMRPPAAAAAAAAAEAAPFSLLRRTSRAAAIESSFFSHADLAHFKSALNPKLGEFEKSNGQLLSLIVMSH
jgi:hypothetical protein